MLVLLVLQDRSVATGGNLVIPDTDTEDSGSYVCTATNRLGAQSDIVRVTVKGH